MKTILFSLLLSASALTASTTVTFAQKSGDEAAIQKVLNESRAAFGKRDLPGFAAHFIKSPTLYYQVYAGEGQLIMAQGWEAMTHMVGGHMKNDADAFNAELTASDTRIHVNGNMAWVTQTGHWEKAGQKSQSRDLTILEKQANQWKIAALTSQTYTDGKLVMVK